MPTDLKFGMHSFSRDRRYRLLSLEVIRRAADDARGCDASRIGERSIEEAHAWLTHDSPSRSFWCEAAGCSPAKLTNTFRA